MPEILLIHPEDKTTDFLRVIYEGRNWTVINNNPSKKRLKELIKAHDRIIMLGHGTPNGLIGHRRNIIDSTLVYLLRGKGCVSIWCNADIFVRKYGLKGFYTGMVISELPEAVAYNVAATQAQIDESNAIFADSIRKAIESDDMLCAVKRHYVTTNNNPVILFNQRNLYSTNQKQYEH